MDENLRKRFVATPIIYIIIDIHKSTIKAELDSYREYIRESAGELQKKQTSFNVMIENLLSKDPQNRIDVYEWYEEQSINWNDFFPFAFNNSTYLTLYSFFEYNLKDICQSVHKYGGFTRRVDFGKGDYIGAGKKYLQLAGLDLADKEAIWGTIRKHQELRNSIVHNNSNIFRNYEKPIEEQSLYNFLSKNKYIKLDNAKGTFKIGDYQFLIEFCDQIESYLITILDKISTIASSWK